MSAFATRAYMAGRQHVYLAPLPLTGGTAEAMARWIDEGIAQDRAGALTPIHAGQSLWPRGARGGGL